jgi:hypothetical protein
MSWTLATERVKRAHARESVSQPQLDLTCNEASHKYPKGVTDTRSSFQGTLSFGHELGSCSVPLVTFL